MWLGGRAPVAGEVREVFWRAWSAGAVIVDAAAVAGVSRGVGWQWVRAAGGVRPRPPMPASGRFLSVAEREEIAVGVAARLGVREIARRLGRAPSTISRELARNCLVGGRYRAVAAERAAALRRRRPKPARLAVNHELRELVQAGLANKWSPEQISRTLVRQFPNRPEMHVSHETIYQSLYVQGRGRCAANWLPACAPGVRSAAPSAVPTSAAAASPAW